MKKLIIITIVFLFILASCAKPPADVPKADITPIQDQNKDVEVAIEMGTTVTEVPDKEETDQVSNEPIVSNELIDSNKE